MADADATVEERRRLDGAQRIRDLVLEINNTIQAARGRGLDVHIRVDNEGHHGESKLRVMNILRHTTVRY